MIGYRQTLLVFLLMMLSGAAIAQNNTNSPYTRYGYGQLADQVQVIAKPWVVLHTDYGINIR